MPAPSFQMPDGHTLGSGVCRSFLASRGRNSSKVSSGPVIWGATLHDRGPRNMSKICLSRPKRVHPTFPGWLKLPSHSRCRHRHRYASLPCATVSEALKKRGVAEVCRCQWLEQLGFGPFASSSVCASSFLGLHFCAHFFPEVLADFASCQKSAACSTPADQSTACLLKPGLGHDKITCFLISTASVAK